MGPSSTQWHHLAEEHQKAIFELIASDAPDDAAAVRATCSEWKCAIDPCIRRLKPHRIDRALTTCFQSLATLELRGRAPDRIPEEAQGVFLSLRNLRALQLPRLTTEEIQRLGELTAQRQLTRFGISTAPFHLSNEMLEQLWQWRALTDLLIARGFYRDDKLLGISQLTNLRALEFEEAPAIEGGMLSALHNLPLTRLALCENQIEEEHFDALLAMTRLRVLALTGNSYVDPECYDRLSALKELRELDLSQTNIDHETFDHLKDLAHLTRLALREITFEKHRALKKLGELTRLKALDLTESEKIPPKSFKCLSNLTGLSELIACYCGVPGEAIATWGTLTALTQLNTSGAVLNAAAVTAIAGFKRLKELDLSLCEEIPAGALSALNALSELLALNVCCTDVTDEEVASWSELTRLTRLEFSDCFELAEGAIPALQAQRQLRHLDLDYCKSIPSGSFRGLTNLEELRELHLSGTEVSHEELQELASLRLTCLRLSLCSTLTGEAIASLVHLTGLRVLSLNNCEAIPPGAFGRLSQLRHLRELSACKTSLTASDLKALSSLVTLTSLWLSKEIPESALAPWRERCQVKVQM